MYIGQSVDIKKRWQYYKTKKTNVQPKLQNSFNKHGADKHLFEIVELCPEQTLNHRERYWQEYYDVLEKGLNLKLTPADEMGRLSQEVISKRQESRKLNGGYRSVKLKQQTENVAKRPEVQKQTSNTLKELWKDPGYRANRKPITRANCPHCGLESNISILKRWHFNNCKKAK